MDPARGLQNLRRALRFPTCRRRAGKIAHLPPATRLQINLMLRDGLPYADIIARLGDAGKALNKDNLSRWRKADYQDWLDDQLWLEAAHPRPLPHHPAPHPPAIAPLSPTPACNC